MATLTRWDLQVGTHPEDGPSAVPYGDGMGVGGGLGAAEGFLKGLSEMYPAAASQQLPGPLYLIAAFPPTRSSISPSPLGLRHQDSLENTEGFKGSIWKATGMALPLE